MSEEKQIKQLTGIRLDPSIINGLKHLAIDLKRSYTSLAEEAFKDLLAKYKAKK
jgi:predicted transcriptional regulator